MRSLLGFVADLLVGPRCRVCGTRTRDELVCNIVNHPGEGQE